MPFVTPPYVCTYIVTHIAKIASKKIIPFCCLFVKFFPVILFLLRLSKKSPTNCSCALTDCGPVPPAEIRFATQVSSFISSYRSSPKSGSSFLVFSERQRIQYAALFNAKRNGLTDKLICRSERQSLFYKVIGKVGCVYKAFSCR